MAAEIQLGIDRYGEDGSASRQGMSSKVVKSTGAVKVLYSPRGRSRTSFLAPRLMLCEAAKVELRIRLGK